MKRKNFLVFSSSSLTLWIIIIIILFIIILIDSIDTIDRTNKTTTTIIENIRKFCPSFNNDNRCQCQPEPEKLFKKLPSIWLSSKYQFQINQQQQQNENDKLKKNLIRLRIDCSQQNIDDLKQLLFSTENDDDGENQSKLSPPSVLESIHIINTL